MRWPYPAGVHHVPSSEVAPRVDAEALQEAHRNDYVNDVGTLDAETVSHEAAYRVAPALAPCTAPRTAPPRPPRAPCAGAGALSATSRGVFCTARVINWASRDRWESDTYLGQIRALAGASNPLSRFRYNSFSNKQLRATHGAQDYGSLEL